MAVVNVLVHMTVPFVHHSYLRAGLSVLDLQMEAVLILGMEQI